jgi:hypothetical protein
MRPGITTTVQTSPPPSTPVIATGTWFITGYTVQGPMAPTPILSFQQFQQVYGPRTTNSALMSDAAETFFARGGALLVVGRVVGPAAVNATVVIPSTSLVVTAVGPGAYANGYKVVVTGSGPFTIQIQDSSSNVLETSNSLATTADAVAYGQTSSYVTVTASSTTLPTAGTYTLASGADDFSSITATQYTTALTGFTYQMGPGQVSAPGQTTTAILTAVAQHAAGNNRRHFGDLPDTANTSSSAATSTLTTAAASIRGLGLAARDTALWAPWVDIPPVTGGSGNRPVPPSAIAAAAYAVIDTFGNPNQAAAGVNGIVSGILDVRQQFTDLDRATLNLAGVNIIRPMAGGFRIYGFVTAVDRIADPLYYQLPNRRLDMYIRAQGEAIAEEYFASQIDGQGLDAARYGNELSLMLGELYSLPGGGALYGATAQDAFTVDTGADVNTPTSESLGNLTATLAYRRSPGAEQVNLNIVRVPITQAV